MDNKTSQDEELLALQSIYVEKDLIIENFNPPQGRFVADVQLPSNFSIRYSGHSFDDEKSFQISYLPPIDLIFTLPDTYPSNSCPAFLLSCRWLTELQLTKLCQKLESIWIEGTGQVILFSWVSFLQEEALNYLGITDTLILSDVPSHTALFRENKDIKKQQETSENELSQKLEVNSTSVTIDSKTSQNSFKNGLASQLSDIVVDCNNDNKISSLASATTINADARSFCINGKPNISGGESLIDCRALSLLKNVNGLIIFLQKYDKSRRQESFKQQVFTCEICFLDKRGRDFIIFDKCGHKYCHECLKYYLEIQIADGNVHSLNCPDASCKCQADGTLVKSIVDEEFFKKYDAMLLSRTLESMSDIAYCPRQVCQNPVLMEMESKMGRCAMCSFVFCVFCRMGYHGVAPCNLKLHEKREICKKYMESSGDEKSTMERRYGKKELRFLVDNMLSEEWVDSNSKKCPQCCATIEKNDGCNKMTCFRCGAYFCWLCMAQLMSSNPYFHFSDRKSRCYNQLFPEDFEFVAPGEFLEHD